MANLLNYVPAEERHGIELGPGPHWEVSSTKDYREFFRALPDLVPEGSVLYLEGCALAREIRLYAYTRAARETSKVAMGTIWPRPKVLHIPVTRENLAGLAQLAEHHAEPEVADHVHVYKGDEVLLEWYDAPDHPLSISTEIPEDKVMQFCARLGVTYTKAERRA
ncbi:MAG: hypothetical protein JSV65_07890 [Armatimonadota bacterium]|nr:MAG: hypothetical protein JSV65_07890 [Armatimonadota bacterium]